MIRIGVVGATGKLGRVVCRAVIDDPGLELVAAVGRSRAGRPLQAVIGGEDPGPEDPGLTVSDRLDTLLDTGADVAVDFTHPDVVMDHARWYLTHGVHSVIGTTGISPAGLEEIRQLADAGRANIVVSPDFSPTGVVMLHIATIAARYLDEVELLEIHPPTKADAPSGTTVNTARTLAKVRAARPGSRSREVVAGARGGAVDGIRVHSIRLSGAVGHEEIRFAHRGDTLTISATSHEREGYAAGVLLAARSVASRPGLTYGLEPLLGFAADTQVPAPAATAT